MMLKMHATSQVLNAEDEQRRSDRTLYMRTTQVLAKGERNKQ